MYEGYYYRLLDRWTSAVGYAPRWFAANAYPQLDEDLEVPEPGTLPSGGVPADWGGDQIPTPYILEDEAPSKEGNLLQSLFEIQAMEAETLAGRMRTAFNHRAWGFDTAEAQFGWVLEVIGSVGRVEVQSEEGTWIEVGEAPSELDLFYSGGWRWKQEDRLVLLHGFDLAPLVSRKVDGWQFVPNDTYWDPTGFLYLEHPSSLNWIPIHPSLVRKDGFLGFHFPGDLRLRARRKQVPAETIKVRIDGVVTQARRVPLQSVLDERGLRWGLVRQESETNQEFGELLLRLEAFGKEGTIDSFRSALSVKLRRSQLIDVAEDATGFTLPSGTTGYQIRNERRSAWVTERPTGDSESSQAYLTATAQPTYTIVFFRGRYVESTVEGGRIRPNTYLDSRHDPVLARSRIENWVREDSDVVFTANREPHATQVLVAREVDVVTPSVKTLKEAFAKYDPSLRWGRGDTSTAKGLAVFD